MKGEVRDSKNGKKIGFEMREIMELFYCWQILHKHFADIEFLFSHCVRTHLFWNSDEILKWFYDNTTSISLFEMKLIDSVNSN